MKYRAFKILLLLGISGCTNAQKEASRSSKTQPDITMEVSSSFILNEDKYSFNQGKFIGNVKNSELTYDNQLIMGKGKVALSNDEEISDLKIGEWLTYHENGQIKTKGKYEIGKYVQCCFSGPCSSYYNYKVGLWEYFHINGKLSAKGIYDVESLQLNTSCERGADLLFGTINDTWEFYSEKSDLINVNDSIRLEMEKIIDSSFGGMYLIPNKEEKKIRYVSIE